MTRILLVMDPHHRSAAICDLERSDIEFVEASDLRSAGPMLRAGAQFDAVITDVNLPDGNWCSVLRRLLETGVDAQLIVCAARPGRLLCGNVVARGGYYALTPPHTWQPLRTWLEMAREATTLRDAHRIRKSSAAAPSAA